MFQRAFERYRALDPGADPRRSLDEEVARRAAGAMVPGVDNVVARGMEPDWAQGELDSLARRAKDTMGEDDYVAMVRFTNGMRRMIAELRRRFPDDADWDRGAVVAPSVAQAAVPVSAGAWACHGGTRQAMPAMASTTSTASSRNSARQPTSGNSHCTGSVAATMPSDPVISIQELARSCTAGSNQRR